LVGDAPEDAKRGVTQGDDDVRRGVGQLLPESLGVVARAFIDDGRIWWMGRKAC
jgi:hypothetical protein